MPFSKLLLDSLKRQGVNILSSQTPSSSVPVRSMHRFIDSGYPHIIFFESHPRPCVFKGSAQKEFLEGLREKFAIQQVLYERDSSITCEEEIQSIRENFTNLTITFAKKGIFDFAIEHGMEKYGLKYERKTQTLEENALRFLKVFNYEDCLIVAKDAGVPVQIMPEMASTMGEYSSMIDMINSIKVAIDVFSSQNVLNIDDRTTKHSLTSQEGFDERDSEMCARLVTAKFPTFSCGLGLLHYDGISKSLNETLNLKESNSKSSDPIERQVYLEILANFDPKNFLLLYPLTSKNSFDQELEEQIKEDGTSTFPLHMFDATQSFEENNPQKLLDQLEEIKNQHLAKHSARKGRDSV